MKPWIWYRALAVILAIFTLGHTLGTRHAITTAPGEAVVIAGMQGYRVPVMGFLRTYWEFYRGFSISISVLLATLTVIAWQLATMSRRNPREALPLAVTVAPLTTTVMTSVPSDHAGVASGVNNTVARVAGLLAIAVFGVVLTRRFDAEIRPQLEVSWITPAAKAQIERELPKMAGAQLDSVALDPPRRSAVNAEIHEAFLSGYRLVTIEAAVLALIAAGFGAGVGETSRRESVTQ